MWFVRLSVAGVLVGALIAPGLAGAAAPSPTGVPVTVAWRDLGTLGGAWSTPTDVNGVGQVVGYSETADGGYRAFRWHRGVLADLGALSGNSAAFAVNEQGEVVGSSDGRPVRWRDGVLTDLVAVHGPGEAMDINDRGEVIGVRYTPTSGMYGQGFLWRHGRSVDLPGLGGDTYPVRINNRGEVVGFATTATSSEAVLWRAGRLIRLAPPTMQASMAHDINDRGQVLGTMKIDSGAWHGFIWQDGVLTDLGELNPVDINVRGEVVGNPAGGPGPVRWYRGTFSDIFLDGRPGRAVAINGTGSIAGEAYAPGQGTRGVVWTRNRLIDLGPLQYGISTGDVRFMNDRGLVVGVLNHTGTGYRAVVWDTARR